ncbi:MAG TPA: hypothetical protein VF587_17285 [Solirubrobacteraceae bacterium]|jgi:hypothetical protein
MQSTPATRAQLVRADPRREDRLRVAVYALGGFALIAGPLLAALNPSTDVLLIAATALVLIAPLAVRAVQGRFDPFEPIVIFCLAYGVMFVVRPAAMLVNNDMTFSIAMQGIDVQDTFRPALVLGLLGAIGFVGAHSARLGSRIAERIPTPPEPSLDRILLAGGALWGFGAVLYGLFLSSAAGRRSIVDVILSGRSFELTQAYKASSGYLYNAPFLMVSATLIFFGVGLARRSGRLLGLAAFSTATLLLLLGPSGSRTILFPLLLGLGVIYYTNRGTRPKAISLLVVTLLALTASAILLDVRSSAERQAIGVSAAVQKTLRDPIRIFAPLTKDHDAAELPALAAALNVVPSVVDHQWASGTAQDALARPIPRQLWSGKPRQPKERVIEALWPTLYQYGVANPEFSVLLPFYIDGGYPGALVGMMLYGLLAGTLYRWYRRSADNVGTRVMFASALPFIVSAVRDTPVDTLYRLTFVALPVLLIFYFVASPERTARVGVLRPRRAVRRTLIEPS